MEQGDNIMEWSWSYREGVRSNLGILTKEEQEKLRCACIGVAGCGGIGGHAATDLANWGIGRVKLADFDVFETSNANRQLYASFSTVGKAKLKVVAQNLLDISPDIRLELYENGITLENAEEFARGCDIVLDAIDYEAPKYSIALHRSARRLGIPVYVSQCIGFGASMFAFYPDGEPYEQFLGLDPDIDLDTVTVKDLDLRKLCPIVPHYFPEGIFERVIRGDIQAPVVIAGQTIAVGLTVSEMVLQLTKSETRRPLRMSALDVFEGRYVKSYELPGKGVSARSRFDDQETKVSPNK
ncbi:MAG: ThiF family adenylyltransferase [Gammaproteobacteria bacterium]